MPRRKIHVAIAVPVGAGYAALRSKDEPGYQFALATVGGAIGGYLGGITPDLAEPATSPRHRDFLHSWTTLCTGLGIARAALPKWEQFCRERAAAIQSRLADPALPGFVRFLMIIEQAFWLLIAGVLAGFVAGYASHIALDMFSPASIPVFVNSSTFAVLFAA